MSSLPPLLTGESVVIATRRHPIHAVRGSGIAAAIIVAGLVTGWLSPDGGEGVAATAAVVIDVIAVVLVAWGVAWVFANALAWRTATFAVTDLRIIRTDGLFRRTTAAIPLAAVTDVRLRASALGRVLGYGDVAISTAPGTAPIGAFTTLRRPAAFRATLVELVELDRRGIRAAMEAVQAARVTPKQAPAVAGAAPPGAPTPGGAHPHASPAGAGPAASDLAAAVARLGSLRDRGVLTDAEFETARSALLGSGDGLAG